MLACPAAYINAPSLATFDWTDGFPAGEQDGLPVIALPDPHPAMPRSTAVEQFVVRLNLRTCLAKPIAVTKWTDHGGDSIAPHHNRSAYNDRTSERYVLES
jgi:hypothetical protein